MYVYIFENFRNKSQTQPLLEEKLQPSLQLKKVQILFSHLLEMVNKNYIFF